MSSLVGRPSPLPGLRPGTAPLRVQRSDAWLLLAVGLGVMLLASAPPAFALRGAAPEVALTIAAFTCTAALLYTTVVLAWERRWLTTTVLVTDQALEVRPAAGPFERVRLVDIRRMRSGRAGLVVQSASGRETAVGRLRRVDARRLVARLESCTGVPVEEPEDGREQGLGTRD